MAVEAGGNSPAYAAVCGTAGRACPDFGSGGLRMEAAHFRKSDAGVKKEYSAFGVMFFRHSKDAEEVAPTHRVQETDAVARSRIFRAE